MQSVIILCPFYNDEASFNLFSRSIIKQTGHLSDFNFSILVVNDGSDNFYKISSSLPLNVIHLHRNLGHQKAIAIGLAYANSNLEFDKLIIMDCDGEDRAEDIERLISASNDSDKIIVAKRERRQEGRQFRLFYILYKILFKTLTGKRISFGNFVLIPKNGVRRLVYYSEIWSHLAGGILKSNIPYLEVPTYRGKRIIGNSKMTFGSLLLHGLSAIGVFIDVIATRVLIFSLTMIFLSLIGIGFILAIKFFTSLAIPGWATTAISSTLIILLQSFLLSLFTVFLFISSQAQLKFIPAHHYNDYICKAEIPINGT